jgi:23S rRNA (guanosine2251-2'-O)-methyltransferase
MKKRSMDELNRLSKEEFKSQEKREIVVMLDNIRSMHNVGSVFRTADAFAIEKIILLGITAVPPHREIEKTALGATETVAWEHQHDGLAVIDHYKNLGYTIAAIEQAESSHMLDQLDMSSRKKMLVILGNEVDGVQQALVDQSDLCIEIPQFGTKHSLNVSVAAGIVLYALSHAMTANNN